MPFTTDERLKSYLDTNQLAREQMCLAALALDKRFSAVRPRHPRGGPDGGRDIEAKFRNEQRAFGAVGFVNQADDSDTKKKTICKKFADDLDSALLCDPPPQVFVFFTNVNLTIGEKSELNMLSQSKGITHCEIFDREMLRIALDSTDGFAIRFQYLAISLSEAEQASFFAKWGDDINSVITTGFQQIQKTLDHLLFLQESTDPLHAYYVSFELDQTYRGEDIGHFRAFCLLQLKEPKLDIFSILFGASDRPSRFDTVGDNLHSESRPGIVNGVGSGQWIQRLSSFEDSEPQDNDSEQESTDKYHPAGTSTSIGVSEVRTIAITYRVDTFIRLTPVLSLRDFDDCMFIPMLNLSLAKRVKRIHIISNGYKLLEISSGGFHVDATSFDPNVPTTFNESELTDPWVRIRPNGSSAFRLRFSQQLPHRLFITPKTQHTAST